MAKIIDEPNGFLRLPDVLKLVPISRASWWRGISVGLYPQGVKISERCTAWRKSDIATLCEKLSRGEGDV